MTTDLAQRGADGKKLGARSPYSAELIDYALWMVAIEGGSASRAHNRMIAEHEENPKHEMYKAGVPTRQVMTKWSRITYKNRYTELLNLRHREMDEAIASEAQVIAQQIASAEVAAIKQTQAGIAGANGVEASQILRNLSQSKQVQLQQAGLIRERPLVERQADDIHSIARSLNDLAGGHVVEVVTAEDVRDAEVVEDAMEAEETSS